MISSIRAADVHPITGFPIEEFSAWFEDGFRALRATDPALAGRAFYPLHNLLFSRMAVTERLYEIYKALPDAQGVKSRLRRGLAIAFERLARDADPGPHLYQVLEVAQLIAADELAHRLLGAFVELGPNVYAERLVDQAMAYLSALAPFGAAPNIVRDLLTLPDAPPRLAISGWLIMCRCAPWAWAAHLGALRERIAISLRGYTGPNSALTADDFASFMPLAEVAGQLGELRFHRNQELAKDADNWLLNALVREPNSPYRIVMRHGELELGYRDNLDGPREPIGSCEPRCDDTNWFLVSASSEYLPAQYDKPSVPRGEVQRDLDAIRDIFRTSGISMARSPGVSQNSSG